MDRSIAIHWFRRDLRLEDNAGLHQALAGDAPVLALFIFDQNILDLSENQADRRVEFIQASLAALERRLRSFGTSLLVRTGRPIEIFRQLVDEYALAGVWANGDYEPYATGRDGAIKAFLAGRGIPFHLLKDQVLFEKNEVVKDDGKPYTVFTPYSRRWKEALEKSGIPEYPVSGPAGRFLPRPAARIPSLEELGYRKTGSPFPENSLRPETLREYAAQRDWPGVAGTTRLGVHLRFGTVSIRAVARLAVKESDLFLRELIWREFFQMILWHFPAVGQGRAFYPAYDDIRWRNDEKEFDRWCSGHTGYPIVDAGMRELNATGYMHNRVRMVVASFLAKHLLIDWRWGEAYFAEKLLDFDLAANNGNWQWAAGCGCDAAPYFRVFNPTLQAKRWDPDFRYVRQWVPEWGGPDYPVPIVDHEMARKRALEAYRRALRQ